MIYKCRLSPKGYLYVHVVLYPIVLYDIVLYHLFNLMLKIYLCGNTLVVRPFTNSPKFGKFEIF